MKKFLLYVLCILFYNTFCVPIHQVIVPMAGLGTRLLPITKSLPKSMVPLVDRPALHHIVEEGLQSGITDFCFIINDQDRKAIESYFSPDSLLDSILEVRDKSYLLAAVNDIIARATFSYI